MRRLLFEKIKQTYPKTMDGAVDINLTQAPPNWTSRHIACIDYEDGHRHEILFEDADHFKEVMNLVEKM